MFTPYNGPWTFEQAAHLLRRTTFGPSIERIQQALDEGFDGSFDTLFSAAPIVDPPIHFNFSSDPEAGIGETWVDKPLDPNIPDIFGSRGRSLHAWWLIQMHHNNQTITEKLTLFWHNHFVINVNPYPNAQWWYLKTLREFAFGNFKELTKRMTIDKGMLVYLTGVLNYAAEPNENYARELLELFTIGKGDLVGPGDYTNYTEQDVSAIAAALTGWSMEYNNADPNSFFVQSGHDTGTKQLSHRFDNVIIQNADGEEYKNVVDIIFQQNEVARHICRRLYIWFVNFDITEEIETEIIQPMSELLIANDYEIRPALIGLLKSQHFFDFSIKGCVIKNPIDLVFSILGNYQLPKSSDILLEYKMWNAWYYELRRMGMAPFEVPSVAGWLAYYQEPGYYKDWVNSASMSVRTKAFANADNLSKWADPVSTGFDWISFVQNFENPLNPNDLIDEVCTLLFPRPMNNQQKAYFKNVLLNGLPDFEWTDEYGAFLADPTNDTLRSVIYNKLHNLFDVMTKVPEFQLS